MPAGPHDFGKIDSVAVKSPKMMVIRNHDVAAIAEKINHALIFGSGQMMGLEIHRRLMTPIIRARMNVRHQIKNLGVGQVFLIELVNDTGNQILHPRVSAFRITGAKTVSRIDLFDRSETVPTRDFPAESILKKSSRGLEQRLDDFRNRSFHGI